MNEENKQRLCRTFPGLYVRKVSDAEMSILKAPHHAELVARLEAEWHLTNMRFGFAVGDGWADLVFEISEGVTALCAVHGLKADADKVEEKSGMLRMHFNFDDLDGVPAEFTHPCVAEIRKYVKSMCERSAEICYFCGGHGTMRRDGWHHPACDACEDKYQKDGKR